MKILLLIIPSILLIVPTTVFAGVPFTERTESTGVCSSYIVTDRDGKSRTVLDYNNCEHDIYVLNKNQNNKWIISIYEVNLYNGALPKADSPHWNVPSWTKNINDWYYNDMINEDTQQRAFDYIVHSDIAEPRY